MILAIEQWKAIPGHDGYEASDLGAIRNASGRLLKPWAHTSGHLYLRLGRGKSLQAHHLVLSAFGVVRPGGLECRHLDGNPRNNALANLQWGTRLENIEDYKATSGRYPKAGMSDETARRVRGMFSGKHGDQSRIARELGIHLSTVNRIIRGKTYAHLGS